MSRTASVEAERAPDEGTRTASRMAALDGYDILDSSDEPEFDDVARLASIICRTPIAVVNLIADERQWFKSEIGLNIRETPIEISLCRVAILEPHLCVVPDLSVDPRFSANPLVRGSPGLRFYAGQPLLTADGVPLGTLCVLDYVPRPDGLNDEQAFAMGALARQVMALLDGRRALAQRRSADLAVRTGEALDRMIVDSATDYAIISTDRDGNVTSWNEGACRVLRWSRAEMIGRPSHVVFTPEDIAAGIPAGEMAKALAEGRSEDERWHVRRDGSRFWASGMMTRLSGDEGEHLGFVKFLRDRTAQREMEIDLQDARDRLTALVELASVGIAQCDPRGTLVLANGAFCALLGRDRADVIGRRFAEFWGTDDLGSTTDDPSTVGAAGAPSFVERQITRPDGSRVWIKVDASPTGAGDEATRDVILVVQDVSARHDAESQHRLLMGELSHRVKNTLAMVQAIATQTLRNASSPAEARTTLESRIMSLARAHDLLLQEHWAEASIRALILGAIQFHKAERFRLSGPDIKVGPKGALSLALCLHELATNATKYGALSNEVGHVELGWSTEEADARVHLVFSWIERGGPPVVAPTRKGFGSRLVQMGLSGEGEVTLTYDPAGLSCRMSAPLDTIQKS